MQQSILRRVLLGVAVLPAIAVAIAIGLGAYMLSTSNDRKVPIKQIVFDLSYPDEIRRHVSEWIPFLPGETDELIGAIEGKPVEVVLKQASKECTFESALITVSIDVAKKGSVKRIFISSQGMTLDHAISSMQRILEMLDAKPDKLQKWTKGALAWSKAPKSWPQDMLSPMDAWYSEIVRTQENEYELEIRSSGDDGRPWRIIVRTGPRLFPVPHRPSETLKEGQPGTIEE